MSSNAPRPPLEVGGGNKAAVGRVGNCYFQSQYPYSNEKASVCVLEILPAFLGMLSSKAELSRVKFQFGTSVPWLTAVGGRIPFQRWGERSDIVQTSLLKGKLMFQVCRELLKMSSFKFRSNFCHAKTAVRDSSGVCREHWSSSAFRGNKSPVGLCHRETDSCTKRDAVWMPKLAVLVSCHRLGIWDQAILGNTSSSPTRDGEKCLVGLLWWSAGGRMSSWLLGPAVCLPAAGTEAWCLLLGREPRESASLVRAAPGSRGDFWCAAAALQGRLRCCCEQFSRSFQQAERSSVILQPFTV